MFKATAAFFFALAFAAPAVAAPSFPGSDPSIRPQDDLFSFANGGWLKATEIPGDKKSYGTFMILREKAEENTRAILEAASKNPGKTPEDALIGNYYASILDEKTIEKQGLAALKTRLARIDRVETLEDFAVEIGNLMGDGIEVPIGAFVMADQKSPDSYAVYWTQSGLGLPDRDYYLKEGKEAENLLDAYKAYLVTLNRLAGTPLPAMAATQTLNFETALAKIQWTKTETRNALKTHNPVARAKWTKELGDFPWNQYAKAIGMSKKHGTIVRELSYLKAFTRLATAESAPSAWRSYLRSRLLDGTALHLPKAFRDARFKFRGQTLQGLKAEPPRWRTAAQATDEAVGEVVGRRYVAKHFPSAAKAQVSLLVANILSAYRASLESLDWMTPATRKAALAKLATFRVKIGYSNKWRSYKGLVVRRDDAAGNMLRANKFIFSRDMSDAGKKVDSQRWEMTPQTVNAYYSPVGNEIVFPAAILQPPFFDPRADNAYNYGAIGAVIGHEISHGFDDQGRNYDAQGNLRDWWTEADSKAFVERSDRLVSQYDAYEPLPGFKVNGRLTLGENIADLAGVTMALQAYRLSLGNKPAAVIDGWTGGQRFYLGYARNWRSKSRPEWLKTRLVIDSHSPEQYRINGVVTDLDTFYEAFDVKPGDGLYRKPEDRVRIWTVPSRTTKAD